MEHLPTILSIFVGRRCRISHSIGENNCSAHAACLGLGPEHVKRKRCWLLTQYMNYKNRTTPDICYRPLGAIIRVLRCFLGTHHRRQYCRTFCRRKNFGKQTTTCSATKHASRTRTHISSPRPPSTQVLPTSHPPHPVYMYGGGHLQWTCATQPCSFHLPLLTGVNDGGHRMLTRSARPMYRTSLQMVRSHNTQ